MLSGIEQSGGSGHHLDTRKKGGDLGVPVPRTMAAVIARRGTAAIYDDGGAFVGGKRFLDFQPRTRRWPTFVTTGFELLDILGLFFVAISMIHTRANVKKPIIQNSKNSTTYIGSLCTTHFFVEQLRRKVVSRLKTAPLSNMNKSRIYLHTIVKITC